MTGRVRKTWKTVLIILAMLLFWTFIVCYPNPFILGRNIVRYLRFPVDPSVVEIIESEIPDEPAQIEKFTKALVQYEYDWKNYGFPDYVSTARQAVTRRKGDCEDRAIVLASLLEAKNIPYDLKASLVHFWVDYPGKSASRSENEEVSYFRKVDGKYRLKLPDLGQWQRYLGSWRRGIWDYMPLFRKVIMILGWVVILFSGYLLGRRKGQAYEEKAEERL